METTRSTCGYLNSILPVKVYTSLMKLDKLFPHLPSPEELSGSVTAKWNKTLPPQRYAKAKFQKLSPHFQNSANNLRIFRERDWAFRMHFECSRIQTSGRSDDARRCIWNVFNFEYVYANFLLPKLQTAKLRNPL